MRYMVNSYHSPDTEFDYIENGPHKIYEKREEAAWRYDEGSIHLQISLSADHSYTSDGHIISYFVWHW